MPNNVEIKAQVNNIEELTKRARELSGTEGELLQQEDTFFMCQNGRLKLRVLQVWLVSCLLFWAQSAIRDYITAEGDFHIETFSWKDQ